MKNIKNIKDKVLIAFAAFAFIALMVFNVTVSTNGSESSIDTTLGTLNALASGVGSEKCGICATPTGNWPYVDPNGIPDKCSRAC